jgi:hypothetical protein
MDEQPATTAPADAKHSIPWGFIVWPLVIPMLYVLSWGPGMMMYHNGRITSHNQFAWKFYAPCFWAYSETPLHKPLGMYLHLWVPQDYDKTGENLPSK